MHNDEEKQTKRPPRGPMGHGPGVPSEKAKDFKGALKRLFKELDTFKILIGIALVLAVAGSILSILAPNKLSDFTDEVSKGQVVNSKNLTKVTTKITSNLNEEELQKT